MHFEHDSEYRQGPAFPADPRIREQLEALTADKVLIGVGTDGRTICVDLDADSPHVMVCSGSGGTTTTLGTLHQPG
ncbi:hypothetical protein [Streptomyces sp. NPDC029674]|uniref:hypothetical protein n=1 Tax=Streptomyces sp. NPDC029674 TaxID=3365297 RepID=UPI00384A5B25